MTKGNMIRYYRRFSAADKYILGFTVDHKVYMILVDEIMPRLLSVSEASRGQGENLRFRPKKADKLAMVDSAICLGNETILIDPKYNKGEAFERIVTEYYGQTWVKDNIPFTEQGDIRVDNVEIQIKLENATLMSTSQMHRLQRAH